MPKCSITVNVKVSWWLKLYLHTLSIFCYMTGQIPDWDKVGVMINRGVSFRTKKPKPSWLTELIERCWREKERK